MKIVIKEASPEFSSTASKLIISTGKRLFYLMFGNRAEYVIENLFKEEKNLFSYRHTFFAFLDGSIAGLVLSYSRKEIEREARNTGRLFLKYYGLPLIFKLLSLKKMDSILGDLENNDYYVSHLAVLEEYRRRGVGKGLLAHIEQIARQNSFTRVKLDVESENLPAIKMYKKAGYYPEYKRDIKFGLKQNLSFIRMVKKI